MPENKYALHRGAANNPTRKHRYNGHVYCGNTIHEHRSLYFLVLKIAAFRGVIENSTWNPAKNSIVVNFNVGADLREAIKATTVGIIGEKGSAMYIGGVQDASTRAQDASATAGRAFTLTGSKLKVVGTDPSVGITLKSSSGKETKVAEDLWVTNDPSKLTFIIPADLADGTYELKITTQFGSNSKTMLKVPRSVMKTIYIGKAPDGGGLGPDGGLEEDPLG